eukprot:scaffold180943_cov47-Prasinocladus_malaysianus.AAC.1
MSRGHQAHAASSCLSESIGPAGYDYLQLSSIYGQPVSLKKKAHQASIISVLRLAGPFFLDIDIIIFSRLTKPVDGRIYGGAEAPSFKLKGRSAVDIAQERAKELPGPGDYTNELVAVCAYALRAHANYFINESAPAMLQYFDIFV